MKWEEASKEIHKELLRTESDNRVWKNKVSRYLAYCVDGGVLNT